MGDYNADPNPNLDKMHTVAFGYELAPLDNLKVDQFSTSGTEKVYTMNVKIGKTRLKFLVAPTDVPG